MDLSSIFLPKMPPAALISLTASLNPLTSASPYAAAAPELVVTDPNVMTSLSDSFMLSSLVAYMLPPEHAVNDNIMAAAMPSAAAFPANLRFIAVLPLCMAFPTSCGLSDLDAAIHHMRTPDGPCNIFYMADSPGMIPVQLVHVGHTPESTVSRRSARRRDTGADRCNRYGCAPRRSHWHWRTRRVCRLAKCRVP